MVDEGDSSVCENPEGSVALLAFRTLLKELLSIGLPSPKVQSAVRERLKKEEGSGLL